MVRPVIQTQQAGGEVDAAHAWHAMRSDHLGRGDEHSPGSVRRLCRASISLPVPGTSRLGGRSRDDRQPELGVRGVRLR